MIDLQQLQARIWANKEAQKFNLTNIEQEFNLTYGELAEAYESYRKDKGDVGEELADVFIFLVSLAKMLNVDLEREIMAKLDKNESRQYVKVGSHRIKKETI